jgi:hypothetical protein
MLVTLSSHFHPLAIVFFAYIAWQFEKSTSQSERHKYSYTIELLYHAIID